MLVQLLHPISEGFLTSSQHAQEWILGVQVKWRKHYVALLVLVSNLNEDQSAVVLVVHQALEAVSAVHCQERNEINNHPKENRDWHSRKFFSFIHTNLSFENLKWIIKFSGFTSKKDDLSRWSPPRDKLRRIHRITTLAVPLLWQDDF